VGRFVVKQSVSLTPTLATFLVEHTLLGFPAVLKVELSPNVLVNEATALGSLESSHTPLLYARGEVAWLQNTVNYLIEEFVDGRTLTQTLRLCRRLEPSLAVMMCLHVLSALDDAHRLGVVHGDVTPDNIFLVGHQLQVNPRFMLVGFGASRSGCPPQSGVMTSPQRTQKYVSPQVHEGGVPNTGSDLFAVGCLLFEAIAGEHPKWEKDGRLTQQLAEVVPAHPDLSRVVAKAIAPEPKTRFETAQDFATVLLALDLDELAQFGVTERTALDGPVDTVDTVDMTQPRVGVSLPESLKQRAVAQARPILLSTRKPKVWVFAGDPGLDQPQVEIAIGMLLERYDVTVLDAVQRERRQGRVSEGDLPWVVVFGDLHALLDEPLLQELSCRGETMRVLVSTHDNVDMLSTTVNATGLDAQVSMGKRPDALVELIDAMVERARATRIQYDGLRLAVADAHNDVECLRKCFERKSA
jgi:serine/threonine protein kinase